MIEDEEIEPSLTPINSNVVKIHKGKVNVYVSVCLSLLKECNEIRICASDDKSMNKAITVCEIVKRRVEGLHQITKIPFPNDDEKISISLFFKAPEEDPLTIIGYQKPLAKEDIRIEPFKMIKPKGSGQNKKRGNFNYY